MYAAVLLDAKFQTRPVNNLSFISFRWKQILPLLADVSSFKNALGVSVLNVSVCAAAPFVFMVQVTDFYKTWYQRCVIGERSDLCLQSVITT
jgi:hypothetical protein